MVFRQYLGDGVLEAVRALAHRLQRAAAEPPRDCGHGAGVRPGADPAGRGPAVPAAQQPESRHHQPEGDQSETANVPGKNQKWIFKLFTFRFKLVLLSEFVVEVSDPITKNSCVWFVKRLRSRKPTEFQITRHVGQLIYIFFVTFASKSNTACCKKIIK